jgi:RHS repeat-associated protein
VSGAGPDGYFPSAYEACRAQWQKYQGNRPNSRYIGAKPYEDKWTTAGCQWTSVQYLCPEEHGGSGSGCGTVLPSIVQFRCESGTPTADGNCRASPPVERPCDCGEDGRINPTAGNPIVLSTGAKILSASDFETTDGDFRIGRHYRSFQVGRPIKGTNLPRSTPRGLAGGWNFDFGYEIQLGDFSGSPSSPNATVAVLAPDGSGYGFVLQANGQWAPDPAFGAANAPGHLKLEFVGTLPAALADIKAAPSSWKLVDREDNDWTFETRAGPNGGSYNTAWPTRKVERDGYSWTFAYSADSSLSSITDSFGRTATFSWHKFYMSSLASPPAGARPVPEAVAAIALPDGTSLHYGYDPLPAATAPSTSKIKRLVKVERRSAADAVLESVAYLYEDGRFATHVTGIVDNRPVRVATYAYDPQGRAILTQGADGNNSHAVEYGVNGTARTRRVTDPLGKAATYTFSAFTGAGPADYRLTQIAGEASQGTAPSVSSVGYSSSTFVGSQSDAEGRALTSARDSRGRPTAIVEASGTPSQRTTTITWHPTLNVPVTLSRPGLTETRSYNAAGQLETVMLTDTTGHSVPYPTNGQVRTWTYGWNAAGRLLSVNGPLPADSQGNDDTTSFTYDAQGNLLTATDALGHVTAFAGHDAGGRPGTATDPNGIVTAYGYDALGRLRTITLRDPGDPALHATTTMSYDGVGRLTELALPATAPLLMDYDSAGRLAAVRSADGERWDYAYDRSGNPVRETVRRSNGTVSRRIDRGFDELGRLVRQTTGLGQTARLAYDKVGNAVSSTSPNGQATTAAFDALDRVITTVAPDSGTTVLAYDSSDNLVAHTDPIAVTTVFVRNGFGDVIQEVSPDRGTSTYWYDPAGELVQSSDGRGQVVAYTRDYLGRLTGKTPQGRPASEAVTYVWDSDGLPGSYPAGRLAKVVDGTGTTRFQYDHRGNLLAKAQTVGATADSRLVYAYDLADRITQITYPSGRIVHYGYDPKGRVNLVETKASASASSWTTIASDHGYEPFGPVKAMTLGNGLAVANDWGDDGRLASRRLYRTAGGAGLSDLAYRYDADGNIGAIDDRLDPSGSVLYGYDKVGRLTLAAMAGLSAVASQTYAYTPGTNRLASLTDAGGTRTIAYDGRGNSVSETRPGSSVTAAYDGYGRLIGYDRSSAGAQSYAYNGLDDRVAMASPAGARRFVYDSDGRVLGEYGASAADVKAEFVWALPRVSGGDGPFGGGDGVGGYAPLAVATPDSLGAIQINWVHGNHLGVPRVTTDSAGNPAATPNDYLLPGFPGQSQVFADFYYNRYRDYDSATGRYVQADPIGLAGGSNPYLYAEGNPINVTDPDGRVPIVIPVIVGARLYCSRFPAQCAAAVAAVAAAIANAVKPRRRPVPAAVPVPSTDADCAPSRDDKCPPCRTISGRIVPVGTVGYRPLETPARPQHGITGPHHNLFRAQQNPNNCRCFWQKINTVKPIDLPVGAIPIEPFAN